MIRFGAEVCGDPAQALRREWLETNGLGGFACSTIIGLNTRRYHGLLTAALQPPAGRLLLLSKLEETLVLDDHRYELSSNQYPGTIHPEGHRHLRNFRLDPFPVFTYTVNGGTLDKTLFLVHGRNLVVVGYRWQPALSHRSRPAFLEVYPLLAFRDYHALTHCNEALNPEVRFEPGMARMQPYAVLPPLFVGHNAAQAGPAGLWFFSFEYEVEKQRGLDFREDLFCPLVLIFDLRTGEQPAILASTEPCEASAAADLRAAEIRRRRQAAARVPVEDPSVRALAAATDAFLVSRGSHHALLAGYPWFTDWSRDTLIALPGATLVTRRYEAARSILKGLVSHLDAGLLPNRFPDQGDALEYNSVDAPLWLFEAVRRFLAYTEDDEFVRRHLFEPMKAILDSFLQGTRFAIRADGDGLLEAGQPGSALTWMDARVGQTPVTPRWGKPVEIEALWYNALRVLERLVQQYESRTAAARYRKAAVQASRSFNRLFWNQERNCLYDVVRGEDRDSAIRPNQLLAVSLSETMLSKKKAAEVLEVVETELLTPVGLRTLSPADPKYRGRYEGDVPSRDSAYHQGTVWPWLMGAYITATLRVHGRVRYRRRRVSDWLESFSGHLADAGLGQVSEIFDGEEPHEPRGCFAQAWSVAELLRAAVEDVHEIRPPFDH